MKKGKLFLYVLGLICIFVIFIFIDNPLKNKKIIDFIVDVKKDDLSFFYENSFGKKIKSLGELKKHVEKENNKKLVFAMNGGMYMENNVPMGLLICENKIYKSINKLTPKEKTNFYLQPNGVFYVTKDTIAGICKTQDFNLSNIKYATQSGPMLLIDGKINTLFKKDSENLNIRNGVGIMPDNKIVFAISEYEINFYDFANYFKKMGCKNALFLDGYVSRAYIPSKKIYQTDGDFGAIIAVTKQKY